jgi:2-oxoisovalerate dehydrogenase E1 component alpha subunit
VARTRRWLEREHGWSREEEHELIEACEADVEQSVQTYLATPPQAPEAMFDYLYDRIPEALARQRRRFMEGS